MLIAIASANAAALAAFFAACSGFRPSCRLSTLSALLRARLPCLAGPGPAHNDHGIESRYRWSQTRRRGTRQHHERVHDTLLHPCVSWYGHVVAVSPCATAVCCTVCTCRYVWASISPEGGGRRRRQLSASGACARAGVCVGLCVACWRAFLCVGGDVGI
ncbi:hypothetical protein PF011_g30812 [Phytophthora fragariae]|uniref:Secreted protein n=2 Tax=Phytophthora fragariae TaxID=53985 RepID=A0A6A3GLM5_9STRA|nr:hypothetical protein PF011_g30812 [Phytophthora fragariae]